jgi:hypothetical protein
MLNAISKLGPVVDAGSAAIAAIAGLIAYRQYCRAQQWRKGDLAAALLSQLDQDDELAFACHALDWGTGPLIVPPKYRPLLKKMNSSDDCVVDHDIIALALALQPKLADLTRLGALGLIYRQTFDKVFGHFDNIERLVESQQLQIEDLVGLKYWLDRIAVYEYPPPNVDGRDIFQPALHFFGYSGIPRLGRRLNVVDWSVFDECDAARSTR